MGYLSNLGNMLVLGLNIFSIAAAYLAVCGVFLCCRFLMAIKFSQKCVGCSCVHVRSVLQRYTNPPTSCTSGHHLLLLERSLKYSLILKAILPVCQETVVPSFEGCERSFTSNLLSSRTNSPNSLLI